MQPKALLEAVEKREAEISSGFGRPVAVTTGLGHSENTASIREKMIRSDSRSNTAPKKGA